MHYPLRTADATAALFHKTALSNSNNSSDATTVHLSEPDEHGHWGKFGGRYVPETLVAPLEELTTEFMRARGDPEFTGANSMCCCAITLADRRRCFTRNG